MTAISRDHIKTQLTEKTLSGSFWLVFMRFGQQSLGFVQIAILGRLLSPTDFGLMGIATLAANAIAIFLYTGYEYALIQAPELSEEDVHTAFWVMLGRRVLVGLLLAILAFPISYIYKEPQTVPILLAMAIIQLVAGLTSPMPSLVLRELNYRRVSIFYLGSTLISLVFGVSAALVLRNVWALVIANFSLYTGQVILSYWFHPYRPRWCFSKKSFLKFSSYGRWMLGSMVMLYLFTDGASAFAGWMFGVTALGLYQMAARFALLPSTQLGDVIGGSLFPAYSLIQEDNERISKIYLRTLSLSSFFIIGLTVIIVFGLPPLFIVFLGDHWVEAAKLIPFIGVAAGITTILKTGSPLFLGTGHPAFQFVLELIKSGVCFILLYPLGIKLGLTGLPYAMLAGTIIVIPIWFFLIRKSTQCTQNQILQAMAPSLVGAIVMISFFYIGRLIPASCLGEFFILIRHICIILLSIGGFAFSVWVVELVFPGLSTIQELQNIFMVFKGQMREIVKKNSMAI